MQVTLVTPRVLDRLDLPENAGSITLYDWMAEEMHDGRNLVRADPDGRVVWKAVPPLTGRQDCFTKMRWDGQALTAHTWSCYRVSVDVHDGSVTILEFTK